jgi:hypothetical protein
MNLVATFSCGAGTPARVLEAHGILRKGGVRTQPYPPQNISFVLEAFSWSRTYLTADGGQPRREECHFHLCSQFTLLPAS